MARVQGDAGDSLAYQYDVRGSRVDLNEFKDGEGVSAVHDMAQVIASERMWTQIRYAEALAVAQSTDFNAVIDTLPGGVWRLLVPRIIVNANGRVRNVVLSLREMDSGGDEREIPILQWDVTGAVDREVRVRWDPGTGTVGDYFSLVPQSGIAYPTIGTGSFQPAAGRMYALALRGTTLAFGAGTVDVRGVVQIAFVAPPGGGLDYSGYLVPSW